MSFTQIATDTIRVRKALAAVYTPEGIDIWLNAMNRTLDRTPNQAIAAGETEAVLQLIESMTAGAE